MISKATNSPRPILSIVDLEIPVACISSFLVISRSISSFHKGLYVNAIRITSRINYKDLSIEMSILICFVYSIYIFTNRRYLYTVGLDNPQILANSLTFKFPATNAG